MASLIDNIANAYDDTKSYVVGNYVTYNKLLYKCLESTTGTFDESKWEKTYMTDLMGGGTTVEEFKSIAQEYVSTNEYNEDDVILKDDKLYQCNTDGTTGSWDSDKWDEVLIPDISHNSNLANINRINNIDVGFSSTASSTSEYKTGSKIIDLTSVSNYQTLTIDKIIIELNKYNVSFGTDFSITSKIYDNITGKLTVNMKCNNFYTSSRYYGFNCNICTL